MTSAAAGELILPSFGGSRLDFHTWLETIVGVAFNFEPAVGTITSFVLTPDEYAHIPRAGYVPATADAPETLAPDFAPLVAPAAIAANAPNATVEVFRQQQEAYRRQQDAQNAFLRKVYNSLGERVQQFLRGPTNNVPFYSLTLGPLFQALRNEYGRLTTADVDSVLQQLEAPMQEGQSVEDLIDQHRKLHATLAATPGAALSDLQKIAALRSAITKATTKFAPALHIFDSRHSLASVATFRELETVLRTFRPDHRTAPDLHYSASAAASSHTDLLSRIESLVAEVQNLKRKQPPPTTSSTGRHYCWTHGIGGHPSHKCSNPADGHSRNATARNTMGGSTRGLHKEKTY